MTNDVGIKDMWLAGRQVIIERTDGSLLFITPTSKSCDVAYAPDGKHYPEHCCVGQYPSGPFDPIN